MDRIIDSFKLTDRLLLDSWVFIVASLFLDRHVCVADLHITCWCLGFNDLD